MAQAFAFGFGDEDIERDMSEHGDPLEEIKTVDDPNLLPKPQSHDMKDLVRGYYCSFLIPYSLI